MKAKYKCEYDTNLTPYEEIAYRIVEKACIDYALWVKCGMTKDKDKFYKGSNAKKFLESQTANFLLGADMDFNIREWLDEQLACRVNINGRFLKAKRKDKRNG